MPSWDDEYSSVQFLVVCSTVTSEDGDQVMPYCRYCEILK